MCKRFLLFTLVAAVLCSTVVSASPNPEAERPARLLAAAPVFFQASGEEFVTTYDDDCRTPKTFFVQGEVVCARAESFPLSPSEPRYRLFQWGSPDGFVAQEDDINSDPEYRYFKIPFDARVGTWVVKTTDSSRDGYGIGSFIVRSRELPWVNLQISKVAPDIVYAGRKYKHQVYVYSTGPDDAVGVRMTDQTPSDMIFIDLVQTSGPEFRCATPQYGGTGEIVCDSPGMKMGDRATFTIVYAVNSDTRIGTPIRGVTNVYSRTAELDKVDSESGYEALVGDPDQTEREPPPEP
ncbi:MAG TPA: hypothetical protein VER32_08210 [Pyrinomonadaceae bacterium]|nr:hypothetical protein [Pyrinomonadaceae bacterium]